jgi:hypothetical protein
MGAAFETTTAHHWHDRATTSATWTATEMATARHRASSSRATTTRCYSDRISATRFPVFPSHVSAGFTRSRFDAKKKSLRASEQARPDVQAQRNAWQSEQTTFDPDHLVFLDETGATTKMTRTHGRCPRGQRLVMDVPHGHWCTTTFVVALRCTGLVAPTVIELGGANCHRRSNDR